MKQVRLSQLQTTNQYLFREKQLKDYASRLLSKQNELNTKKKLFKRETKKQNQEIDQEIQKFTISFENLEQKHATNIKSLDAIKNEKQITQNQIDLKNNEIETMDNKEKDLIERIAKLQSTSFEEQIQNTQEKIEEIKQSQNILQTNIEEIQSNNKNIQEIINKKKKNIVSLMEKQNSIKNTINTSEKQQIKSNNQIKDKFIQIPFSQNQSQLSEIENRKNEVEKNIAKLLSQYDEKSKEELQIELKKKKTEYETKINEIEIKNIKEALEKFTVTNEVQQIKSKEAQTIQQKYSRLKEDEKNVKNQIQITNEQILTLRKEIEQQNNNYQQEEQAYNEIINIYSQTEKEIQIQTELQSKIEEIEQQKTISLENAQNNNNSLISSLAASNIDLNQDIFVQEKNENETKLKTIKEELKTVKDANINLIQKVAQADTNNKIKEIEIAKLIRSIKQCLKLPPDLTTVLNDNIQAKGRFKNANDIIMEISNRKQKRENSIQKINDEISAIEINVMNKQRKINNLQNYIKGNQEQRLKMILFNYWLDLLVNDGELTLESFGPKVDFIYNVFKQLKVGTI